jgi:hypothetical protein
MRAIGVDLRLADVVKSLNFRDLCLQQSIFPDEGCSSSTALAFACSVAILFGFIDEDVEVVCRCYWVLEGCGTGSF